MAREGAMGAGAGEADTHHIATDPGQLDIAAIRQDAGARLRDDLGDPCQFFRTEVVGRGRDPVTGFADVLLTHWTISDSMAGFRSS